MSDAIAISRASSPQTPPNLGAENKHLPFLDGIRALMACWVACGHAFQDFIHVVDNHMGYAGFLPQPFFQEAFFAHFAVDVFIVLSGFCLMLPVSRTSDYTLSGGWKTYLKRRSRRILPPYYAALCLAGLLSLLRWCLTNPGPEASAIRSIDFRPSAVIAHICLVQNLWDPWARALDGPTWSVATEFQIYLLFPTLLLPLWRKLRPHWVVLIASALGTTIFFLARFGLSSCSWYLGLFAMGMYSADWYIRSVTKSLRRALPAASLSLTTAGIYLVTAQNWMPIHMWALDLIFGAATALLLAYLASADGSSGSRAFLLLEWPPLVTIGTFSYSFYLIHAPLLNVPITLLLLYRANGLIAAPVIIGSLLVIMLLARIFYMTIELPGMARKTAR